MSKISMKQTQLLVQIAKQFTTIRRDEIVRARETQDARTARLMAGKSVAVKL